jgi:[ribosomal protein S5]-alanine N-acetyltransferase
VKLSTERLILREFNVDDVHVMHAWQIDPRYLEHYPVDSTSLEDTRDLITRFLAWQRQLPRCRWQLAIELHGTGELIGSAGIRRASVDALTADVGYELNPAHWGHGYATEAMRRMLGFAVDELQLTELTARVVDTNAASLRVLQRLGFTHSLSLAPGAGRDGRIWPQRAEYRLLPDR